VYELLEKQVESLISPHPKQHFSLTGVFSLFLLQSLQVGAKPFFLPQSFRKSLTGLVSEQILHFNSTISNVLFLIFCAAE
jgi:uncharacterized integral membrane protein